jgi:hypothetical protein
MTFRTGAGLAEVMTGADAVIDVTSMVTTSTSKARAFFTAATRNLVAAERTSGVGHHVALSVVGIDVIDTGYYAGKLAQEREVSTGAVPWSVQGATQFHEFASQVLQKTTVGPIALVPKMPGVWWMSWKRARVGGNRILLGRPTSALSTWCGECSPMTV